MKTIELTKHKLMFINGGQGGRTLHKPGAISLQDIRDFISSNSKFLVFLLA